MSDNREYGLDLFRIMAMIMITVLHIVNQHLGMLNTDLPSIYCHTGYFMEYACFAGVNCFALLSGYLLCGDCSGYSGKWFKRFVSMWLKMILWGFLLFLITGYIFQGNWFFNGGVLKALLFPLTGIWWYISAYMGLLVFIPLINKGIAQSSDRDLLRLALIMFAAFSIIPIFTESSGSAWNLGLSNGYTMIWLLICYLYGAVLKRLMPQLSKFKYLNLVSILILIISIGVPLLYFWYGIKAKFDNPLIFMDYISPFCVAEAVCLFILCNQIKLRQSWKTDIIVFISSNSLGIYLLQLYPDIWKYFMCQTRSATALNIDLLWYFPGIILLLMVGGIIGNIIIDKIYQLCHFDSLLKWGIKYCRDDQK